jgi:hypothetical protein
MTEPVWTTDIDWLDQMVLGAGVWLRSGPCREVRHVENTKVSCKASTKEAARNEMIARVGNWMRHWKSHAPTRHEMRIYMKIAPTWTRHKGDVYEYQAWLQCVFIPQPGLCDEPVRN